MILSAVARCNGDVLEIVCAVCILQWCVINEDRLSAVFQPLNFTFAEQVKNLRILLGIKAVVCCDRIASLALAFAATTACSVDACH